MHKIPMQYLKDADRAEGGDFFDSSEDRCRVEVKEAFFNPQTQDAYFVTSECFARNGARLFRVRVVTADGHIRTACPNLFSGLNDAVKTAEALAH